ncbi:hypothetical protein P280DRAFT_265058 [Massarina eburnea CBS 473.64]|uniref:Uncharacterized protein n=1 Tax=Massarina eburnea CBS 473.64 TaxID=1395130 RepID=A0A6A6S499_9PLEO|nr:hypothetical protein P280DRAFT_265058 [Massarina eburnea CBS 473.64]
MDERQSITLDGVNAQDSSYSASNNLFILPAFSMLRVAKRLALEGGRHFCVGVMGVEIVLIVFFTVMGLKLGFYFLLCFFSFCFVRLHVQGMANQKIHSMESWRG